MARLLRVLGAVGLALAFTLAAAPKADAQSKATTGATKKKKKKKKKKPAKPGGTEAPVEMGDLDEPAAAPAPVPGAAPATSAGTAPSSTAAPTSKDAKAEDEDHDDEDKAKEKEKTATAGSTAGHPLTAMLLLGAGLNSTACGTGTCNAYGFGLGLRGGYTLPSRVYVGGTFVYHLGYNSQIAVGAFTRGFAGGVGYIGPEVGYDLEAGPFLIRPFGGLGIGLYRQSDTGFGPAPQATDSGGARFAFWPGVTGMYPVSPLFFVGADVRFVLVASGSSGFSFFALGGLRL